MNTAQLIYSAIQNDCPLPCEPVGNVCAVTGERSLCVPRKKVIGASFTNGDMLRRPSSPWISVAAYQALKYKWQRMSCWLCTQGQFERLADKNRIRSYVLNGVTGKSWAGFVTTSYKKHGLFYSPVNDSGRGFWGFDTATVDCRGERPGQWYNELHRSFVRGLSRTDLLTLSVRTQSVKQIGPAQWLDFKAWAKDKYQSPLYAFMVYLLPSKADLQKKRKDGENEPETAQSGFLF